METHLGPIKNISIRYNGFQSLEIFKKIINHAKGKKLIF